MDDPGSRGTLTIDDRVGEKIAVRTALAIDGVIEHRSRLGALLSGSTPGRAVMGGDYPSADIDMSSPAPKVTMSIAVHWPAPVTAICRRVRTEVADELGRLTGVRPTRVDVTVAAVVPSSADAAMSDASAASPELIRGRPVRRGYVELPPVDLAGESVDGTDELERLAGVWRDRVENNDGPAPHSVVASDAVSTPDAAPPELIRGRPVRRGYIVLPPWIEETDTRARAVEQEVHG